MALTISTTDPDGLLKAIKEGIEKRQIETWACDSDGDFTHSPVQWNKKAWLRPKSANGVLSLELVTLKDVKVSAEIYGVYHGRFIEMLLAHFGSKLTQAIATPQT